MATGSESERLFAEMKKFIPGGVNSPVRSFGGLAAPPIVAESAAGSRVTSADGDELIDYIHGWGSVAVGHAHPQVVEAIARAAAGGTSFGLASPPELEYARLLAEIFQLDKVRAVCSGTEATMSALRLARGFTGKDTIVKFAGCYHGHSDCLLVAAGSGAATFGTPSSAGVPKAVVSETLVLPYNDGAALRDCFAEHGKRIAAVIVEPVAGNMNLVLPDKEFITEIRRQCDASQSLLIADEVMSAMRASPALACRDLFGVEPDIACLGKAIGAGMPIAAFGGRSQIMDMLAPDGKVYQAGTLSGNAPAVAAGIAQMRILAEPGAHERLAAASRGAAAAFASAAEKFSRPFSTRSVGGMFGIYFAERPPENLQQVHDCDGKEFAAFHRALLGHGVLLPPSMFEACFVGLAHDQDTLAATRVAAEAAFAEISATG